MKKRVTSSSSFGVLTELNRFALHLLDLTNRINSCERTIAELNGGIQDLVRNIQKANQQLGTRIEQSERRLVEVESLLLQSKNKEEKSKEEDGLNSNDELDS